MNSNCLILIFPLRQLKEQTYIAELTDYIFVFTEKKIYMFFRSTAYKKSKFCYAFVFGNICSTIKYQLPLVLPACLFSDSQDEWSSSTKFFFFYNLHD